MILTATVARRSPSRLLDNLMTFTKSSITATVFAAVLWLACSTACPSQLQAQGPENTLVVVNEESPDSLAIANLYISLRNIPPTNVVYVSGITTIKNDFESSGTSPFSRQIWKPVTDAIKDRGLADQITCITYSAGFPTRINVQPQKNKYLAATNKKYNIQQHAPWASISSLTYLSDNAFSDQPTFLDPRINRFANQRPGRVLQNPFVGNDGQLYSTGETAIKTGEYARAAASFSKLVAKHPHQAPVIYALARAKAFQSDGPAAIKLLQQAQAEGFAYRSLVINDSCFADLKTNEDFVAVLSRMENFADGTSPSRAFLPNSYWSKNGWPSGTPQQGDRYLLSTVLALTGKNQSTLDQALTQIKRSVEADGTKPRGNVYFAKHKDPRSRTRQAQFDAAAAELKTLKRPAKIISQRLPENDRRVVGATLGNAKIDWKATGSNFLPGALCDNFTSYGGWWAKSAQTQLTDFLNAGAAGASGTVYEPYTIPWKIPNARLHAHYARGCTMAESFYQSVSNPFQLLIVGDPLCCPFGDFPEFKVTGLKQDATVTSNFTLSIQPSSNSPKVRHYEIYFDGVFMTKIEDQLKLRVAIDAVSDGFHELRVVGVADSPTANRTSRRLEFVIDRKKQRISLETASTKIQIGGKLKLTAIANTGDRIQIQQNSRTLVSLNSGEIVEIAASKIGSGRTQLQAVTTTADGSVVASTPLDIEVVR